MVFQALKSSKKHTVICVLLLLFLFASGKVTCLVKGAQKKFEIEDTLKEIETLVLQKLKGKDIWIHKKRENKELRKYLLLAGKLGLKSAIPILMKHITYSPYLADKGDMLYKDEYPVRVALQRIGASAIPALLAEIKKYDKSKSIFAYRAPEFTTWVSCLKDIFLEKSIYHKDTSIGIQLAKKRLELELKQTKDKKERANLEAALKDPVFTEKSKTTKKTVAEKKKSEK